MSGLKRFWFEFERVSQPTPFNIGCGLTAFNYDDAIQILEEKAMDEMKELKIRKHIIDVDIRNLDQKHVVLNMGSVVSRGIWFPLGY